jgi:isopenicillin N synthase-like dioxygenase
MSNGYIQAIGSHSELLNTTPDYKAFFDMQNQVEQTENTDKEPEQNGHLTNGVSKEETKIETFVTEEEDLGLSNISFDVYA